MAKRKVKKPSKKKIVVTGDVTIDRLEVSTPPVETNYTYNWQTYVGTRFFDRPGGALLLAHFVRSATGAQVLAPELANIKNISPEQTLHSIAYLDKFPYSTAKKDEKNTVYRVKQHKGFAGAVTGTQILYVKNDDPSADIVVLDDAGNGFRNTKAAWPAALKQGSQPIVLLKMSHPLAQGPLWELLQGNHADQMVVVISADDLRQRGVKISRRLSWERTAKDFIWQMASNSDLVALNNCAYLVVRFGVEGAILYTRRGGVVESRLFYDSKVEEDSFGNIFPGKMQGLNSAFVAAITAVMVRDGLDGMGEGVRQGILSARRLSQLGFGQNMMKLDYPGPEIFKPLDKGNPDIFDIIIPNPSSSESADPNFWCILNDLTKANLESVACKYVIYGADPKLDKVPIGKFRNFRTLDRSEIESFCSIKNLIREYLAASGTNRPLSIAVFGPPGSGKSFGVTEVAESVAPGEIEKIEFNLSQFKSIDDLIAAFHRVRDVNLSGKVPLVFFDEFDSYFNGNLGWLKYFLAPMQDGKFREGETMHPIGRAIFVFAGGTSCTFADFCREEGSLEFKNTKGTDFVSRLRGYVNIKGPNPVNEDERFYMIRRALFLRFLLEKNARHIFDTEKKCRIDSGVLRAMIKIPKYKHGIRSMRAIIEMSMLAGRNSFEQAVLPSPEQLELHVDAEMFSRLVVRDVILGGAREKLAKIIHEKFRRNHKKDKPKNDPGVAPWKKLREDFRESNRQQADHIPVKLNVIGCDFVPVLGRKPKLIKFTKDEIEIMAEMEHARFVTERQVQGWSLGSSNKKKKISPYLVVWEKLPPGIREYDREAVRAIPKLLAETGFEIYRLKNK